MCPPHTEYYCYTASQVDTSNQKNVKGTSGITLTWNPSDGWVDVFGKPEGNGISNDGNDSERLRSKTTEAQTHGHIVF